jgi:hypothetical protein
VSVIAPCSSSTVSKSKRATVCPHSRRPEVRYTACSKEPRPRRCPLIAPRLSLPPVPAPRKPRRLSRWSPLPRPESRSHPFYRHARKHSCVLNALARQRKSQALAFGRIAVGQFGLVYSEYLLMRPRSHRLTISSICCDQEGVDRKCYIHYITFGSKRRLGYLGREGK